MGSACYVTTQRTTENVENASFISDSICATASKICSRTPFPVLCYVIYNKFYNTVIHKGIIGRLTDIEEYKRDWATVVGSYSEKTCVGSSDVDLMRDIMDVFADPYDIPKDQITGLVVVTDRSRMPPGSCWLRLYNMARFDRRLEFPRTRNSLECFLANGPKIQYPGRPCHSKAIDGHTHESYNTTFDKRICHDPAYVTHMDGYKYFSRKVMEDYFSRKGLTVLNNLNKVLPNWASHGPAFQQTYFGFIDVDVVNSLHCSKGWPDSATEWKTRIRKWPDNDTVYEIVNAGFHAVPIASKLFGGEAPDLEWRISFRKAETKLILSFNECQRLCFVSLKIISKEFIQKRFPEEDFMSSYIMKTVMFWTIEETEQGLWTKDNMVECIGICLVRLKLWLEKGFCPNYFIPDYNLFRTKLQRMFVCGFREWLI